MKNFIIVLGLSCICLLQSILLSSCIMKVTRVLISNKKVKLTTTPLTIVCPTPFYRTGESASVEFLIKKKWSLGKQGGIKLVNGEIVFLDVVVIDSKGNKYSTKDFGKNTCFSASFSDIPKNAKIIKVTITSTREIECDKIYWESFNPI